MLKARIVAVVSLLTFLLALFVAPTAFQQETRYYAGYALGDGYYGVAGDIYTIDPAIPVDEIFAQWVDIVIDPHMGYWIQTGYTAGPDTGYELRFYVETMDENGHKLIWVPNVVPRAGITYTYIITGGIFNNKEGWEVIIRQGSTDLYTTIVYTNPYTADDLHAFSETSTYLINIDGTHFSSLSYYTGRSFPLWYQHYYYVDPPYWIQQISHYEFYAGGGGA